MARVADINDAQDQALREERARQEARAAELDADIEEQINRAQDDALREDATRQMTNWQGAKAAYGIANDINSSVRVFTSGYERYRNMLTGNYSQRHQRAIKKIKRPSKAKYGIMLGLALYFDALTIVLAVVALILAVPTLSLTFFLMLLVNAIALVLFAIASRIVLGKSLKEMRKEREALTKDLNEVQQKFTAIAQRFNQLRATIKSASFATRNPTVASAITSLQQKLASTGTAVASRAPRVASAASSIAKGVSTTARFLAGPIVRIGGKEIPIINLLPWFTIGLIFAWVEHQQEYEVSQLMLSAYRETTLEYLRTEDANFEAQVAVAEIELSNVLDYGDEMAFYATA